MSSPLHIVHGILALEVGGLERLVLGLTRCARRAGQRVSVVCVERPGALAPQAEEAGATVVSLGKPPGRLRAYIDRASGVLAELKPDVVHTHQIGAAWYLGSGARRLGVPLVHTEHGNELARKTSGAAKLKTRLNLWLTARWIDRFCCVSDEIAAAVTRWGTVPRRKVEVVLNGIETDPPANLPESAAVRASLGLRPTDRVIGTVGRLVEVKQQGAMIRATAKLRERVPDVHLLLVGDGPERESLERLARDLGAADRVHFAGYQACPEQFLRAMDVFALTSRSEGLPVSLLEAWLAGVPVVASAVGGVPRVVTPEFDGLLYGFGDEGALVASLERVLSDPEFGRRLGRSGRQTVLDKFAIDRMADTYATIYAGLLAGRR